MHDPLESVNRVSFSVNNTFDRFFLKPMAGAYRDKAPEPVQSCIGNISSNLKEPVRMVGHAMTGAVEDALVSGVRLVFNTVVGGFGCLDVAESMKMPERNTDIGLALRSRSGPKQIYLVIPLLGPSSMIDSVGTIAGRYLVPFTATVPKKEGGFSNAFSGDVRKYNVYETTDNKRLGVYFTTLIVHDRSELLDATDFLDAAALDPYLFWRDAYLEQRASLADEVRERSNR